MHRRTFVALVAGAVASTGFLFPRVARAASIEVGIAPIGKRGRTLIKEFFAVTAKAWPDTRIHSIDVHNMRPTPANLENILLVGCLGGRVGLEDTAACGDLIGSSCEILTAVVLWPMEFEGWRREAAAQLGAARLRSHGARVVPVSVELSANWSLDRARETREQALINRALEEIARIPG